jgi:hypothetical protein
MDKKATYEQAIKIGYTGTFDEFVAEITPDELIEAKKVDDYLRFKYERVDPDPEPEPEPIINVCDLDVANLDYVENWDEFKVVAEMNEIDELSIIDAKGNIIHTFMGTKEIYNFFHDQHDGKKEREKERYEKREKLLGSEIKVDG